MLINTWIDGRSVCPNAYGNLVYDKNSIMLSEGNAESKIGTLKIRKNERFIFWISE